MRKTAAVQCLSIRIKGIVQGVGFRPFVYNLARQLSLRGFVTNTAEGVSIVAEGRDLEVFLDRLRKDAPPLSRITGIEALPERVHGYGEFLIRESREAGRFTLLSPDVAICDDCRREMFDVGDRRHLYPFINCTNCGPRYSITTSVPYDRVNTTMHGFTMCRECEEEYRDPANRRFHAQPNACPDCGPQVRLVCGDGVVRRGKAAMAETIRMLGAGGIVAVKGIGGFHIACDAANEEAVTRLRARKRRNNKPFAVMVADTAAARDFCSVSGEEAEALSSRLRPIVLLKRRKDCPLPEVLAPKNSCLGCMLPYTPMHYLLFHHPVDGRDVGGKGELPRHFAALVMTSGNVSEEPIVKDDTDATEKLSGIADAFLTHDRDIFMRVDDSVIRLWSACSSPQSLCRVDPQGLPARVSFIRRSRGYVPEPISLGDDGPEVLGCGADLKNTFTITKGGFAIPSQHIGDMENLETLRFFEETLRNLTNVYRAEPCALAHDLHPGYLSTRWALQRDGGFLAKDLVRFGVQHHYAHVASVMAEKNIRHPVIGVAFDGNGFGGDGTLWGGEFLIAGVHGFTRAGHVQYAPLPGGEMAMREPWRMAVVYLANAAGGDLLSLLGDVGIVKRNGEERVRQILRVAEIRDVSPLSSSAGRVFDGVAALLGISDRNTYEGEAAIALESLAGDGVDDAYAFGVQEGEPFEIDYGRMFQGIVDDLQSREDRALIATKFHNTVARSIGEGVRRLSGSTGLRTVVLSGGVFQNDYLLRRVLREVTATGLDVFTNERVSCNDSGISLGQAYLLRERLRAGKDACSVSS